MREEKCWPWLQRFDLIVNRILTNTPLPAQEEPI